MKIISYIANANQSLDRFIPNIHQAVALAEKYAVSKLDIEQEVNLIFAPLYDFIPEDTVGGRTQTSNYITISLNCNTEDIPFESIFEVVCHELAHASRWQKNPEYAKTLLDDMLFEGLATHFERQALEDNQITHRQFYLKTIMNTSPEEISHIENLK